MDLCNSQVHLLSSTTSLVTQSRAHRRSARQLKSGSFRMRITYSGGPQTKQRVDSYMEVVVQHSSPPGVAHARCIGLGPAHALQLYPQIFFLIYCRGE